MYERGLPNISGRASPAPPAAPAIDKAAAERGKGDFSSSCSFCHGSLATGTEQAPNLLRSPIVFQDHNGDTLGPFLKQGRPTLGMPAFPTLPPEQVAGYRSVSALADPGSPRHPAAGNRVAGGRCESRTGLLQWRGKVQHLPLAHGRPGAHRIKRSTACLDDRVFDSPCQAAARERSCFRRARRSQENWNIWTSSRSRWWTIPGVYHTWPRDHTKSVDVVDPLAAHKAMLPIYTDKDIHDLLAYLVTLK